MAWALAAEAAAVGTFSGSGTGPDSSGMSNTKAASANSKYWILGVSCMRMAEGANDNRVSAFEVIDDANTVGITELIRYRQNIQGGTEEFVVQVFAARNSDLGQEIDIEGTTGLTCQVTFNNAGSKTCIYNCYIIWSESAPTAGNMTDYIEGGICERDGDSAEAMTITHIQALGTVDMVMAAAMMVDETPQPVSGWNMDVDLWTDTTVISGGLEIKMFSRGAATTPANTSINKVETGDGTNTCHFALRFSETSIGTFPARADALLVEADGNNTSDCGASLLAAVPDHKRHRGRRTFDLFT